MTLRPEPYRHLISEHIFRGLDAFAAEAAAAGVDMTALAVAWVLHQPRVDAAIIGPRNARAYRSRARIIVRHADGDGCARIEAIF